LTATDTQFVRSGSGDDGSVLIVEADGQFSATNTTFGLDAVEFRQGRLLHSSDVTGNTFSNPVFRPVAHLLDANANLKNNVQFNDVEIWAGQVVADGQTLNLSPLGVAPDASMRFRLNSLTVETGGQLNATAGSRLWIEEGAQLAVNGTLAIQGAETVTMVDGSRFNVSGRNTIQVNAGGVLTAIDTQFVRSGTGG